MMQQYDEVVCTPTLSILGRNSPLRYRLHHQTGDDVARGRKDDKNHGPEPDGNAWPHRR